jgi:HD-like signal output (HDOD) protein
MNREATLEAVDKRVQELPLGDSSVFRIITLLNDPESNFEQIVARLSPGLAARFLHIANTAFSGRKVRSIAYAVKLLGYKKMKDVLTTSILMDHFTTQIEGFNLDKFVKQAHFCTVVARALATMLDFNRFENLFTVAMLQNIGKLVIAVYFKDELKRIVALKTNEGRTSCEAENNVLGMRHGEIGAVLLERLNIPADICEAVRYHDSPTGADLPHPSDSDLPYIAREATRIVGCFSLPEGLEPEELTSRLTFAVENGKEGCREYLKANLRDKGYAQIFPSLLEYASQRLYRDLKQHLHERTVPTNGTTAGDYIL